MELKGSRNYVAKDFVLSLTFNSPLPPPSASLRRLTLPKRWIPDICHLLLFRSKQCSSEWWHKDICKVSRKRPLMGWFSLIKLVIHLKVVRQSDAIFNFYEYENEAVRLNRQRGVYTQRVFAFKSGIGKTHRLWNAVSCTKHYKNRQMWAQKMSVQHVFT